MKRLFCLMALVGLLAGCSNVGYNESRKDQLQRLGLLGQHDLRRIEQTSGISGSLSGSFFLGIGSVPGNLTSERKLQFYWGRTAKELISTTLPYSRFRFVVDESKTVPTIQFVFSQRWLRLHPPYTEVKKSNPNWWLNDEYVRRGVLHVAVVRISRKDFKKEVYLPRQ